MQDLKYAARRLRTTPLFSAFSVAILTIGIGLNIAVFSVFDALVLRPAPYPQADRVVHIYQDSDSGEPSSTAFPAYRDMAAMTDVFASVAATTSMTASWDAADGPSPVVVDFATASYFPTLGLAPSRGRWFDAEHDAVGAEMVAVVTHKAWQARLGGDPGVIGRTIRLNNQLVTLIGIGPRDFNGEAGAIANDFWLSISSVGIGGPFRIANLERREDHWYTVKARLAPGVGVEQARGALQSLAARLGEQFPDLDRGRDITLFTSGEVRMHPGIDASLLGAGVGLFVVAGVVLLLACSNLGNLLLARGLARAPEIAVREALGGSRARITRPLLLEALLLAGLGGAAGLAAAVWLQRALSQVPLPPTNAVLDLRFDLRMVAFSVVAALGTGLLFGWLPSRRSTRTGVAAALRDAGRSQSSGRGAALLRGSLVAVQVALSVVLVVATALLARSFVNAERVDPGVDVERIAVIGTNLQPAGITTQEEAAVVAEQILERIGALPGVESAAFTTRLPVSPGVATASTVIDGYEPPSGTSAVEMPITIASRSYFATMGIPVLAGRGFAAEDRAGSPPVVILSETAARLFFAGDAVGKRVRRQAEPDVWREVVGVVGDVNVADLQEPPTPMMYWSAEQVGAGGFSVVVRAAGDPAALLPTLPRALREVRESLPVTRLMPLATHVAAALATARTSASLMAAFAALALLLAGLGIYAAVSFAVERRTQEIGIRVALGATATRLVRMVVGESLVVTGIGIAAGLGLAVLAALGLRGAGVLFGVAPVDGVSYAWAVGALAAAAALAAFVPARRAAAANPSDALRNR
jgi:putative ABC transport system permease protein